VQVLPRCVELPEGQLAGDLLLAADLAGLPQGHYLDKAVTPEFFKIEKKY